MAALLKKFTRFLQIIKENGGVKGSFLQIFRTDELKTGTLVGIDKFGNKYFQNKMYFMGRSRWVDYSLAKNLDYDGSQVPAEWHRWLHYMTDDPPTKVPPVEYEWLREHEENFTGTARDYVPYSTGRPKVQSWTPPGAK